MSVTAIYVPVYDGRNFCRAGYFSETEALLHAEAEAARFQAVKPHTTAKVYMELVAPDDIRFYHPESKDGLYFSFRTYETYGKYDHWLKAVTLKSLTEHQKQVLGITENA